MAVGGQLQGKSGLEVLCDQIMILSQTPSSPRRISPDATSEIHRQAQMSSLRTRKSKGMKRKIGHADTEPQARIRARSREDRMEEQIEDT